ncbi:hypothetical protein TRFO_08082 [Tritrichomonas foetus]|uniref:RRM domain-containing protein n=1 Tax=Tritrichomonas foetus TaxID=1144522 RepID=A0A1J4JLW2_9EUKA|nr:hypothetical protein TRFO_08082 [Tritrichomonas foetus]|eukprot:OHT00105.1 hypothetical protein TRFO_08082 [Tritrichomonas foetus]
MSQLWVGRTEIWEDEEKLIATIRQKCNIQAKSVWFCRNRNTNQLEGYGFIDFETPQEAAEVMRLLKDTPIPHSPSNRFKLNWGSARTGADAATNQQASGFSVYVGNLPISIDEDKLLHFFRRYIPNTISARLIYDSDKLSKGYGFVKFNTFQEMNKAIKVIHGSTEFGRPLKVNEAKDNRVNMDSSAEQATNVLFIRDIDPGVVQAETIFQHFRPFGNVLNVRIVPDHPDWATVKMETVSAAEVAKKALQGKKFGGSTSCDIQYGKEFDETPLAPVKEVSVPIIQPHKMSKKAMSKHFDEAGVAKVMEVIKNFAELNRKVPLTNTDFRTTNLLYSRAQTSRGITFDWESYIDVFPSPNDPFFKK